MKRAVIGLTILLNFVPSSVISRENEAINLKYPTALYVNYNVSLKSNGNIVPAHYQQVFLGCVYSYHECEHLGHARGFYNHSTRHDHRTCHHGPSYACFGR